MFKPNTLFYSDGYKPGHKRMLAPGTTRLYGTWIPRSTKHAPKGINKILSVGSQLTWRWLHDEFKENFFKLSKDEALCFVKDMSLYLGQEYDGSHFEDLWNLGFLPIEVQALPEGIETLPNIPHMTFINTIDGFAWLTLYLETIVSALSWKMATNATIALKYRRNVEEWVNKTDPNQSFLIPYLCHDFSSRGLDPFSMLSSGLGHATSFRGSDSLIVIPGARYFYDEPKDEVCINSVNASEHSVSTTKIFTCGEKQMLIDWLIEFPTGILSVVADTFDLWKLITEYLTDPEVKELIMARDGKLVIRPDSGDPVDIICGLNNFKILEDLGNYFVERPKEGEIFSYKNNLYQVGDIQEFIEEYGSNQYYQCNFNDLEDMLDGGRYSLMSEYEISETISEQKGVIELLWDIFGGTINEQGYKVLDPHIGAIYGDSINLERQIQIYERLEAKGFACTNIVLGVGSFTYQFNTRDTFGFAAKGAWFEVEENTGQFAGGMDFKQDYNIYKDPATDDGTKKSLKGFQFVYIHQNEYVVKSEVEEEVAYSDANILKTIYKDGDFNNQTTLSEIRSRIDKIIL